jgi:hypothetical protein
MKKPLGFKSLILIVSELFAETKLLLFYLDLFYAREI